MNRPGISPETLTKNGVREITPHEGSQLCGTDAAGLWIPYRTLAGEEKSYGRLRLSKPRGTMKYTQQKGTGTHLYYPVGLPDWPKGKPLYLIEGEFKALSLAEHGYHAVGLSGFYGFKTGDEQMECLLAYLEPSEIYWVGDADTLLNPDFYQSSMAMSREVPGLSLLRMPFDGPKGADDMAQEFNGTFKDKWALLPKVELPENECYLAMDLLELHKEEIDFKDRTTFGKLSKTLARFEKHVGFAELFNWVRGNTPYKAGDLKTAMRAHRATMSFNAPMSDAAQLLVDRSWTTGGMWMVDFDGEGEFTPLSVDSWRNQLRVAGADDDHIRVAQAECERHRFVHYAGPICGRKKGVYTDNGVRVLVTSSPTFITGKDPRTDTNQDILQASKATAAGAYFWELVAGKEQAYKTLIGWLQVARAALMYPEDYTPGQCLVMMGAVGNGKTRAQNVITKCLGDRESNPEAWLQGNTPFNSELWEGEHLVLSDASISDDWAARRKFQGMIKQVVANTKVTLSAKFQKPVNLKPNWRVTMSANSTTSAILAVPHISEDTADKIIYLWTEAAGGDCSKKEFWPKIRPSLGDFLWCVDNWEMPVEMRDSRFGVRAWHDPKVVELVHGESSEGQLEDVLDLYFERMDEALEGTSPRLFEMLGLAADIRWIKGPTRLAAMLKRLKESSMRYDISTPGRERKGVVWVVKPRV